MQRTGKVIALYTALLVLSCGLSCSPGSDGSGVVFSTPEKYRAMVTVIQPGKTGVIQGSGDEGVFVAGRNVELQSFCMAAYETTWELWREVYTWALARGYTIANPGTEGHGAGGTGGLSWTAEERKTRPVTNVTWRDAVVWCNAYSEMAGLVPVYYGPNGPLRESRNNTSSAPSDVESPADTVRMELRNNGFRLPLEAEWECAARGGVPAAPAWAYSFAGSDSAASVTWYENNAGAGVSGSSAYGAHPVGSKSGGPYGGANSLGLFDMSGNAAEWCWDWLTLSGGTNSISPETPVTGDGPGTFAHRVIRGGGWLSHEGDCKVTSRNYFRPFSNSPAIGFRLARSL
ncbi:MAG: formylglycine-generating enzyme family protein [Spirochaetaceae bacterium]|jgi:formylglycine-generating enzyme required for sulfatase activity|nr:formylglycine-generating enzyme family protein [Spirochaetaceae bacterium]